MKRSPRMAVLVAAGLLAATTQACAQPSGTTAQAAAIAHGHDLVRKNCSACHAIGETGDSPLPLAPPFRTLSRKYPVEDLQESLAEGIVSGHPAMPQFRFTPADVNDLIAYLKSIQTPQQSQTTPP